MEFVMKAPDDFHLHLRSGNMLRAVLPHTTRQFRRAVIMPNTTPPVLNAATMSAYRKEILAAATGSDFEPLMTIQITEETTPETIFAAKEAGAVAGKVYPRGMTTNSANGVFDYRAIYTALAEMEKRGMLALFHGESPAAEVFCLDREVAFLEILREIAATFPRLKIVMEHMTTAKALECIAELPGNVGATITVHHLLLTLDNVIGDKLRPHHFCKPVAKRPEDRAALVAAAMSGNPKFFFGSDSAPHLRGMKECESGCAGIYTAPVALPLLLQFFKECGRADKLEDFCSGFGADFYGLKHNAETVKFVWDPWKVPPEYEGIVPFQTGETLSWRMETR